MEERDRREGVTKSLVNSQNASWDLGTQSKSLTWVTVTQAITAAVQCLLIRNLKSVSTS